MIFKLKNPVPISVVDDSELSKMLKEFGIVPYYGTEDQSSHSFLKLLKDLTALSPTFNSCMHDLNTFAFGNHMDVRRRVIPGLVQDEAEELGFEAKNTFTQWFMERGISIPVMIDISRRMHRQMKDCGNIFLRVRRAQVNQEVRYHLAVSHYMQTAYLRSKDKGMEFIIISKRWDKEFMQKNRPTILQVTEYGQPIIWNDMGGGVEEFVLHIKNSDGNDPSDYYGRPDILSVLNWLNTDYQIGRLNSSIASTEVISKKALAFEAPNPMHIPEDDQIDEGEVLEISSNGELAKGKKLDTFQRNMLVLKDLVQVDGDSKNAGAIVGIEYPHGGKAPIEIAIEMNRDTAHHKFQYTTAASVICDNMNWSAQLLNVREIKSGVGGNMLIDLFMTKNITTVEPIQYFFESILATVNNEICERESAPSDFKDQGFAFTDNITSLVERISERTVSVQVKPEPQKEGDDD